MTTTEISAEQRELIVRCARRFKPTVKDWDVLHEDGALVLIDREDTLRWRCVIGPTAVEFGRLVDDIVRESTSVPTWEPAPAPAPDSLRVLTERCAALAATLSAQADQLRQRTQAAPGTGPCSADESTTSVQLLRGALLSTQQALAAAGAALAEYGPLLAAERRRLSERRTVGDLSQAHLLLPEPVDGERQRLEQAEEKFGQVQRARARIEPLMPGFARQARALLEGYARAAAHHKVEQAAEVIARCREDLTFLREPSERERALVAFTTELGGTAPWIEWSDDLLAPPTLKGADQCGPNSTRTASVTGSRPTAA